MLVTLLSDATLNAAFCWLCQQRKEYSPNSDIWELRRNWSEEKQRLRADVRHCCYQFSALKVYRINGECKQVWSARDALLLKALSILLSNRFKSIIPATVYHTKGRGGIKAALRKVKKKLSHNSHVMCSDVKGYYASINHFILYKQLSALIPSQPIRYLLWDHLHRVCEYGGNYTDTNCGISRSSPLSPLLGALYLKPMDEAVAKLDVVYVRYMDDWVVIAPTRWRLRKAIRIVNQQLSSLRLEQHPDKTSIGKAERGFDFLSYHLTPGYITPSMLSLKRCLDKIIRLYEQGADKNRIGRYIQNWFRWLQGGGMVVAWQGQNRGQNALTAPAE